METTTETLTLADLPTLGAQLAGGKFYGLTTRPDGTHCAVVLLPDRGEKLSWKKALAWSKAAGGELPTRPAAALLYALAKDQVEPYWHWTADELDGSYAWSQNFNDGNQDSTHKSYEARAVAVRLIQLDA